MKIPSLRPRKSVEWSVKGNDSLFFPNRGDNRDNILQEILLPRDNGKFLEKLAESKYEVSTVFGYFRKIRYSKTLSVVKPPSFRKLERVNWNLVSGNEKNIPFYFIRLSPFRYYHRRVRNEMIL